MKDYLLIEGEDGTIWSTGSVEEWGAAFDRRKECKTLVKVGSEEVLVSTAFLGMPHPGGPFETMVFGGERNLMYRRYETRKEAMAGHEEVVKELEHGAGHRREDGAGDKGTDGGEPAAEG